MKSKDVNRIDFPVIKVRFGWDAYPRQYSRGLLGRLFNNSIVTVDCDGPAIFCGKDAILISENIDECCVYFKNMEMFDSAAKHCGDNTTGEAYV